ncbi:hypothetical protein VTK73DRAFT_1914 [Phialemonium thermophilum]|uniref:Putative lipoate-protein ligase A n=1 Tax=Phialemonium thermophilum TaxID=223376 RepID=A0ABR3Y242_9PEZI
MTAVARRPLLRVGNVVGFYLNQTRKFSSGGPQPQVYISKDSDPYVNLSIEHHLLQTSHPDSTILFLYRNRPCVVIGRNQNPWLETNLRLLRHGVTTVLSPSFPAANVNEGGSEQFMHEQQQPVLLVRRRSGGGAVFHDFGNVNWCVICPSAAFDRDKHAEMVVRALRRRLGVQGLRVNCRHDIVQDGSPAATCFSPRSSVTDTAQDSCAQSGGFDTYKVSGSAYKLTRLRSLHHGTCLLRSPNLGRISSLLRSPAEAYLKARGVESVRSPVRNLDVDPDSFIPAVVEEFRSMYGGAAKHSSTSVDSSDVLGLPEIAKGLEELKSPDWIFGQTPQFTFSTHHADDDSRPSPDIPLSLPRNFGAYLTVRHGQVQEASLTGLSYGHDIDPPSQDRLLSDSLVGLTLYRVTDWRQTLQDASPSPLLDAEAVGSWFNDMFGIDPEPRDVE